MHPEALGPLREVLSSPPQGILRRHRGMEDLQYLMFHVSSMRVVQTQISDTEYAVLAEYARSRKTNN